MSSETSRDTDRSNIFNINSSNSDRNIESEYSSIIEDNNK